MLCDQEIMLCPRTGLFKGVAKRRLHLVHEQKGGA
jgi:hypothetical protein